MWYQLATYECYCRMEPVQVFYYVFLASYDHVCTLLSKRTSPFFFLLCASSQPRPCKYMYVFVKEVQSVFQYAIIYLAMTMHEGCCRREPVYFYLLFVSSQPRPRMNILAQSAPVYFFLIIYFQLATTMNKRCCPSDPVFIFIMRFQPSTTMYDRYCRREPVYFFNYMFLPSHGHVCTFLSKRSSQFCIMCFQLNTTMHIISQEVRSITYQVFQDSHDHV